MNILILDNQAYKLVETDKPEFILRSEVKEAEDNLKEAARATLAGEVQMVGVALPKPMDCLKINGKYYGYFPVKL